MIDLHCMVCKSYLVKGTDETSGEHKCAQCRSVQRLVSLGKKVLDKRPKPVL